MGKLTVRSIESAKPRVAPYKLMDGDGLQLRVATNGFKTWLVRYVIDGVERQYRLPKPYRDSGGDGYSSLLDARNEAARIRALAREGVDYKVQRDQSNRAETLRREAEQAANKTIVDLFEAWLPDTEPPVSVVGRLVVMNWMIGSLRRIGSEGPIFWTSAGHRESLLSKKTKRPIRRLA